MTRYLIRLITGRSYEKARFSDFPYLFKKGFFSRIRGIIYPIFAFQYFPGYMVGANVRLLMPRNTKFGKGVFIGSNSYIELYSERKCIRVTLV